MHYLIDGHNLIGRSVDIRLENPDDEVELVLRLRSWAAGGRKRRVLVVFDRGLPGGKDRNLSTGNVQVIFASRGQTADSILIKRIQGVQNPQEYTLVSSDRRIIQAAEARRMRTWKAEEFIQKMAQSNEKGAGSNTERTDLANALDHQLSDEELEMWLNLFDSGEDS